MGHLFLSKTTDYFTSVVSPISIIQCGGDSPGGNSPLVQIYLGDTTLTLRAPLGYHSASMPTIVKGIKEAKLFCLPQTWQHLRVLLQIWWQWEHFWPPSHMAGKPGFQTSSGKRSGWVVELPPMMLEKHLGKHIQVNIQELLTRLLKNWDIPAGERSGDGHPQWEWGVAVSYAG